MYVVIAVFNSLSVRGRYTNTLQPTAQRLSQLPVLCVIYICVSRLLFVLFGCYLCCSVVICVARLLFVLLGCYMCCSVVICVVLCLVCV